MRPLLLLACLLAIALAIRNSVLGPSPSNPSSHAHHISLLRARATRSSVQAGALLSKPHAHTRRKAAICVSGQLRTLHETVDRIRTHLLDVIDDYDIFMYVQTRESEFEPSAGDASACDVFKRTPARNNIFCEVVKEQSKVISDFFTHEMRASYFYAEDRPVQGLLQQLDGLAESNRMRREHSAASGMTYDFTIRVRPDNWFFDDIPALPPITDANRRTIYIPDPDWKCCGNEDIFQMGPTDVMDAMMGRLADLKSFSQSLATGRGEVAYYRVLPSPPEKIWSAEHFVVLFAEQHNITLAPLPGLHVHVKRFDPNSGRENSGGHP